MSAWGKGGSSWADDAEKGDSDVSDLPVVEAPPLPARAKDEDEAFPSLSAAVAKPQSKKEKKKKQTLSLSEFTSGTYVGPGGRSRAIVGDTKKLTAQEMALLPTGPRERAEGEEEEPGFRGFRGGGGDRFGDRGRDREDGERGRRGGREGDMEMPSREESSSSWATDRKFVPTADRGRGGGFRERSAGGGFDDERPERDGPSKADEVSDWGSGKKFTPSSAAGGGGTWGAGAGRPAGGGFEDRGGRRGFDDERPPPPLSSRADEVDDWGSTKKFVPTAGAPARAAGLDSDRWARREAPAGEPEGEQWGKKEAPLGAAPSAADTSDRWKRPESSAAPEGRGPPSERPRLVLQKRTVPLSDSLSTASVASAEAGAAAATAAPAAAAPESAKPRPKSDPFGGAKPREVVLEKKGVKADLERTSSSGSAASSSSASQADKEPLTNGGPPKPKPNPFGAAKPREVLLEEKGVDWRKVDAELERKLVISARPESAAEKALKEEIAALTAKLEAPKAAGEAERTDGEAAAPAEGGLAAENGQLDEDAKKALQKQIAEKQAELESLGKSQEAKGRPAASKGAWGAGAPKEGPKAVSTAGETKGPEAPAAEAAPAVEPASKE